MQTETISHVNYMWKDRKNRTSSEANHSFRSWQLLTFPTFPETGTAEDSRNSRNEPGGGGGGGGVETGREIRVSVVEWCYQRTLFLGLQEERAQERQKYRNKLFYFGPNNSSSYSSERFSRSFSSFIVKDPETVPMASCCNFMHLHLAASLLHSADNQTCLIRLFDSAQRVKLPLYSPLRENRKQSRKTASVRERKALWVRFLYCRRRDEAWAEVLTSFIICD